MNKVSKYLTVSILSALSLTACYNGSSGGVSLNPEPTPAPSPKPDPTPDPGPNPSKPCTGKDYAHALDALHSRNASKATSQELLSYNICVLQSQIKFLNSLHGDAVKTIFSSMGDTISWEPGSWAQNFSSQNMNNISLIDANAVKNQEGRSLLLGGVIEGERFLAVSTTPAFDTTKSNLIRWCGNMISWLVKSENRAKKTLKISGVDDKKLHFVVAHTMSNKDGIYSKHYESL